MRDGILSHDEIKNRLCVLIKFNALNDVNFTEDKDFFTQLYFDSLTFSALIVDIENEFSISITEQDIATGFCKTPALLAELIKGKVN